MQAGGSPRSGSQTAAGNTAASTTGVRVPDSTSFGPEVPKVDRPSGGGSIRGLGERFHANPANGTCRIEVPLLVPDGRAALGEKLVLAYGSGVGDGPFGTGWSLSLPQISRRTDKGIPTYGANGERDVFLLSGQDELVPWMDPTTDGNWKARTDDFGTWVISRFRPRNDSFSYRIEHWRDGHVSQDPGHWRVTSGQNVTYIYGFDPRARVANPADQSQVFAWLLQEVRDDRGNVAIYRYKGEDGAGVDNRAAHERHRFMRGQYAATAQRYLKCVSYANLKPASLSAGNRFDPLPWESVKPPQDKWCFQILLDYGEHDDAEPSAEELQPWELRPHGLSSYRSGFEVRTLRQCRRVLVFHRIPGGTGQVGQPDPAATMECVREHRLSFRHDAGLSFLESVEVNGLGRNEAGRAIRQPDSALPPMRFGYSRTGEPLLRTAAAESGPLPRGRGARWARWVDLNGEGLPGVLWEQGTVWYYRPNRSQTTVDAPQGSLAKVDEVEFAPPVRLSGLPSVVSARPGTHHLSDIDGDGRLDLVATADRDIGFWSRDGEEGLWESFRAFRQSPLGVRSDPQARWIDLTGDGLADILITHNDELIWQHSLGSDGYEAAVRRLEVPREPLAGIPAVFADGTETLFIADMSGDGLPDLVRIRRGSIIYWPNLGYGRFGRPVTMSDCPQLDYLQAFDSKRIRLADIDGSGTTDLLYLRADRIDIYANEAGNRWVSKPSIRHLPRWTPSASVEVLDLLGTGTACVVWSSQAAGEAGERLRALDLTGGVKPHLLVSMDNGHGGSTTIDYTTSAREFLADKMSGCPWHTRVPFPVQVVSRITYIDAYAASQHTTRYRYHHGHFDGREREFRGFGFVEEWNAETFGTSSDQPPRLIKRWFHTGAWLPDGLPQRLAKDYWVDEGTQIASIPAAATLQLTDTPELTDLAPLEQVDAVRALAGQPLREEIYGLDGGAESGVPYVIREFSHELRMLQPRQWKQPPAVQVLEDQHLECVIERVATLTTGAPAESSPPIPTQQPRIQHTLALAHDAKGFVTRRAIVAYGHFNPTVPNQGRTWVTLEDRQFHHFDSLSDAFRIGIPVSEQRQTAWAPLAWTGSLWKPEELQRGLASAQRLSPGSPPPDTAGNHLQLIEARYWEYWAEQQGTSAVTKLGTGSIRALVRRELRLAFTADMLSSTIGPQRLTGIDLAKEGGYLHSRQLQPEPTPPSLPADAWWAPSPEVIYDRGRFMLPKEQIDPFGAATRYEFDSHALYLAKVTNAFNNTTVAETDYRSLSPRRITDENLNRIAYKFDVNARLVAMALMGKAGKSEGDSEDSPTAEFSYALRTAGQPMMARAREREQHRAADTRWRDTITYTDGSGREILRKMRSEPGPVPVRDETGRLVSDGQGRPSEAFASDRWVGSGRVIYNDKGNPIRRYEPYFALTSEFESDATVRQWGVSPTLIYDALDRLIVTVQPDGSQQRLVYSAWSQEHWDEGDSILNSSWTPQTPPTPDASEDGRRLKRCADLSQRYAGTPELRLLDALGRVCELRENDGRNAPRIARQSLDALGNILAIQDAEGRFVSTARFDLLKRPLQEASAAAGDNFLLHACDARVLRRWTARNHRLRPAYDRLRRQTHLYVLDPAGELPDATGPPPAPGAEAPEEPGGLFAFLSSLTSSGEVDDDGPAPRRQGERLIHRVFYGESVNDPATARRLNLVGQVRREFDGAGLLTFGYDFKGNRTDTARRLRRAYRWQPDWKRLAGENLDADSAPNQVLDELENETYRSALDFDALARVVLERHPDGTEIRPQYGDGGLLDAISARPQGKGAWQSVILDIDYNARGQRLRVTWGNGVQSRYAYDPLRFRLSELKSWRKKGGEGRPLQHHRYFHDVAGNIAEITDGSDSTHFYKGYAEPGGQRFEYDALYQLVRAEGRELPSLPPDAGDPIGSRLPHRADLQALARYTEDFNYDREGNLTSLRHEWKGARPATWTRNHTHDAGSNRLTRSEASGSPAVSYTYDASGNLLAMPHLPQMRWDAEGHLASVDRAAGARVWMNYDAQGERVRKVHRHGERVEERIYLGRYEIYRRRRAGSATARVERGTSHLMDGTQRIAMLETLTRDNGNAVNSSVPRWRYQLNDHLGSGCIELDETAKLISFEEFHAFGTTAIAAQGFGEVSARRYRYTGKERDEETGLNYHGARFLACWLGRWISADPSGDSDGTNRYLYVGNVPTLYSDATGMSASTNDWVNAELPIRSYEPTDVCTPQNPLGRSKDVLPTLIAGRHEDRPLRAAEATRAFMDASMGLAHLSYSIASMFTNDAETLMYATGAGQFAESLLMAGLVTYGGSRARLGVPDTSLGMINISRAPTAVTQVENVTAASRYMSFSREQIARKYSKHAVEFNLPKDNPNPKNLAAFQSKIIEHAMNPQNLVFPGTWHREPVTHIFDPVTGINLMRDSRGAFLSIFRPNLKNLNDKSKASQYENLLMRRSL